MLAKTNAQEEELLMVKLKTYEEDISSRFVLQPQEALIGWFVKFGLETTLQVVPRNSQLDVVLAVLQRHEGAL